MSKAFIIGGRVYAIHTPNIEKIILAGEQLGELSEGNSIEDILNEKDKDTLCKTLSCFISGDLSLRKKLSAGSKEEIVEALNTLYLDIIPYIQAFAHIAVNVVRIAATPK